MRQIFLANIDVVPTNHLLTFSRDDLGMGMGKPAGINDFVTKLYAMINDPSLPSISWTESGTSFVVSNVREFSRNALISHFKHNNFSNFVRQLKMYGFRKINHTPRAQPTSMPKPGNSPTPDSCAGVQPVRPDQTKENWDESLCDEAVYHVQ